MRFPLLALFCVGLNAPAADEPTADEQKAIAAVAKLGGQATIDPRLAPEARVSVKLTGVTDAVLIGLKKHPQVGAVSVFDATRCTDKGFVALKDLPKLRKLVVEKGDFKQAAAAALGQCKELRHLGLVGCGVTDGELAAMKGLTMLEHLSLSDNPAVTDKGMATVKGFERLRELYLSKTAITDRGLPQLRTLDGLRTLNVFGTKVTDAAAETFPDGMPNLRVVRK